MYIFFDLVSPEKTLRLREVRGPHLMEEQLLYWVWGVELRLPQAWGSFLGETGLPEGSLRIQHSHPKSLIRGDELPRAPLSDRLRN